MKNWSAFLKDVKPKAPGVPESITEYAIKRAAQFFCDYTRAWVVEMDPVTTVEGVLNYDLELDKAELVRINSAKLNGLAFGVWRAGERECRGRHVFTPDGRTVQFSEAVAPDLPLVLTCAVRPSDTAAGVEDVIHARYAPTIAKLAVADLTENLVKHAEAIEAMDALKTRLWRGLADTSPRTRAQFF